MQLKALDLSQITDQENRWKRQSRICSCGRIVAETKMYCVTPGPESNFRFSEGELLCRMVYSALQGGSIMKGWTNDDRMMIACCNDGTRPVIFKIERIDIPETPEKEEWLVKQNFTNTAEDAYTG